MPADHAQTPAPSRPAIADRAPRCVVSWREGTATVAATIHWTPGADDLRIERDGASHALWDLEAVLRGVPAGVPVLLDFGPGPEGDPAFEGVSIVLVAAGERAHATVSASVDGERREAASPLGIEPALKALAEQGGSGACPRRCFWCAHSDYPPGTGFADAGQLACFVEAAADYARVATSDVWRDRKTGPWRLPHRFVDAFSACDRWTRRPAGLGYRG